MNKHVDKIKTHFQDHKELYILIGSCLSVAGFTCLIMRRNSHHIGPSVAVTAQASVAVLGENVENQYIGRSVNVMPAKRSVNVMLGKNAVLNDVSYISANRQGPPSWVIRCFETDQIFTSQEKAALEMGIHKMNISRHLNGLQDTAEGFHFERICMAA